MELDDYKAQTSGGILKDGLNFPLNDIEKLIKEFREEEAKMKRKSFIFLGILTSLIVIYASQIARAEGASQSGYILLSCGFFTGGLYLYFKYRTLRERDYSLSTVSFLKKASRKFQFFTPIDYLILTPILAILGAGGGLILVNRLSKYMDFERGFIAIWIIFYVGLCIFAFVVSKKQWEKDYGNLSKKLQGKGSPH